MGIPRFGFREWEGERCVWLKKVDAVVNRIGEGKEREREREFDTCDSCGDGGCGGSHSVMGFWIFLHFLLLTVSIIFLPFFFFSLFTPLDVFE